MFRLDMADVSPNHLFLRHRLLPVPLCMVVVIGPEAQLYENARQVHF
jgi:hypothetical protein